MNVNKILTSGVVAGVFSFFLGWLFFGILLSDVMPQGPAGLMRSEADFVWWAMVVSNIASGILLAYIFVHWASISTWKSGLQAGAIIGGLMNLAICTSLYAMSNMYGNVTEMLTDLVANTVYCAIVGAFLGWWLGWRK